MTLEPTYQTYLARQLGEEQGNAQLDRGSVPFGSIEAPLERGARSEGVARQRRSRANAPRSRGDSELVHSVST